MIEINLLPHEYRQAEGTPLPRLLTIIAGAVMVVVGGLLAANYRLVEIPKLLGMIAEKEREKKHLEEVQKRVAVLMVEKAAFEERVKSMRTLEDSRVLWGRVLHRLRLAMPKEGCVLRQMSYRGDAGPQPIGVATGRRYTMLLQGYTTGVSQLECSRKMLDFKNALSRQLDVARPKEEGLAPEAEGAPKAPPAGPPTAAPAAAPATEPLAGFSEWLGLRFEEPVIETWSMLPAGPPKPREAALAKLPLPSKALDFQMKVSFSLKPPATAFP